MQLNLQHILNKNVLGTFGATASASSMSSSIRSLSRKCVRGSRELLQFVRSHTRGRTLVWISLISILATILIKKIAVTKDQQQVGGVNDGNFLTQQWLHYASHSNARNRAFFILLMKVGFKFLMEKIKKYDHLQSGSLLTNGLVQLGPTYVKMGQIVSSNSNVHEDWKKSLETLQDKVPAINGQDALKLVYDAYKDESFDTQKNDDDTGKKKFDSIFKHFDTEPIAAASLGQVHLATLRTNNQTVALKVQRPNLKVMYDQDLVTLQKVAKTMDKISSFRKSNNSTSWVEIFSNAQEILYNELDYTLEGQYGMRLAKDFGLATNDTIGDKNIIYALDGETPMPDASKWIRIPLVYSQYSTPKSLVMEYVPSVKVTTAISNLTTTQRTFLASSLARAYLRQFCVTQFFSTDPHPGNVGVEFLDDDQVRLVLYDFGQACFLNQTQSEGILQVMEGIMDLDANSCVEAFGKMGVLQPNANLSKIRQKVQNNFDTGKVKVRKRSSVDELDTKKEVINGDINPSNDNNYFIDNSTTTVSSDEQQQQPVKDSEIMSFFTLPAEYAFVARAISQMDGVGKSLDPDFDFISSAAPYLVEIKGTKSYLKELFFKRYISPIVKRQNELFKQLGYKISQSN